MTHIAGFERDQLLLLAEAVGKIGPNTEGLISAVLASRPHPEQGFRTCLGILRSYRGLPSGRLGLFAIRVNVPTFVRR